MSCTRKHLHPNIDMYFPILVLLHMHLAFTFTADQVVFHFISGMCFDSLVFIVAIHRLPDFDSKRTFNTKNENKSSSLHCCAPSSLLIGTAFLRFPSFFLDFLDQIVREVFLVSLRFLIVSTVCAYIVAMRKQLNYDLIRRGILHKN